MGKGRACSDPFSLNSYIDIEKLLYLYKPSVIECAPNDPFNDWSVVYDNGELKQLFFDIIDRIANEEVELEIIDQLIDYDGNFIYDTWTNETIYIQSDIIDSDNYDLVFIDNDGNDFTLADIDIVKEFVIDKIFDTISNEVYDYVVYDDDGILITDIDQEYESDIIDYLGNDFIDVFGDWEYLFVDK